MGANTPITLARLRLVKEMPYLAAALWALHPQEKPGLGTLGVDKYWRLYWDPEFVANYPIEEVAGILYHEINHLLRDHPDRGEGKDPAIMNVAADAEINDTEIDFNGIKLPNIDYVTPAKFGMPDGKLAEWYYDYLLQNMPPELQQMMEGGEGGNEEGDQNKPGGAGPGNGKCGSCASGTSQEGESKDPPKPGEGGLSKTEGELLKNQVAKDIKAMGRGNAPGGWERWAEDRLTTKVNWRNKLGTLVRRSVQMAAGAKDFTFKKPSRRDYGDVIMPSPYQPTPVVAAVIDTSGSMRGDQLAQCVAEVGGILKACGVSDGLTAITVDATVEAARKVFKPEQVNLRGGGGTDMRVGVEYASKLTPKPDVCIVLTDGDTPWPDRQPAGMYVVAALIPGWYGADHVINQLPAWMKKNYVVIDDIGRKRK